MQVTLLHGYPDLVGRRRLYVAFGAGPASYVQFAAGPPVSGGDVLAGLPFQTYIDSIPGVAVSTDGTIIAIPQVTGTGTRQTWRFRYFNFGAASPAIGAEVTAATNLSTKNFQFFLIGGQH